MNTTNNFLVRDNKKKTRFFVDNELLEKGYAETLKRGIILYCVLCKYANSKTQICFPGYDTIIKESGIKNRNNITGFINALEYLNIIRIERFKGKKPNIYHLLDISQWKPLNSIPIDTVKRVSKMTNKQYQEWRLNSIPGDTGSHISKSYKEIKDINKSKTTEPITEECGKERETIDRVRKELSEKLGWKNK